MSFVEFKRKYPETASELSKMSIEEILYHYSLEVEEKDDLLEYKQNQEAYITDFEYIINLAMSWLSKNKKGDNYQILINKNSGKLLYTNTEKEFIKK